MKNHMKYSKDGLALTERFEGCRLSAYQDQGGVWTIGYGHTSGVYLNQTITQEKAVDFLMQDVASAEADVNAVVEVDLTQHEFDALVDFAFNCGTKALNSSTLLRLLNGGDFLHAAEQFARWDHVGGKEVAGLLHRRLQEKAEFLEDVKQD